MLAMCIWSHPHSTFTLTFKDFNSETDFVDLKMENIEVYLKPMEKTIDSDAKHLYKEMFLKYIRLAKFNNASFPKSWFLSYASNLKNKLFKN
jgi:hypothetical protein